jgi:uncharacterized protein YggT (Ycf19 family)
MSNDHPQAPGEEGQVGQTFVERLSSPYLRPVEKLVLICGAVAAVATLVLELSHG